MTYQDLTTEAIASPVAVTKWLRGESTRHCMCCPEQPGHVYAYSMPLADPEETEWQTKGVTNQPTGNLDYTRFIHDAIARMPEGTKFRIVVEPITE